MRRDCEGISVSMKKMMLLGALLVCAAAVGNAQESRQDVSASAIGVFGPTVNGIGDKANTLGAVGFLGSYRYSVTPRSGLEANYSYIQSSMKFLPPGRALVYVHMRMQEASFAYTYSRNYHNFNPFVEIGAGAIIFTPITDYATSQLGQKQNTSIGMLSGVGLAYEISPSFDIRAEYRGFLLKTPDFGNVDSCCKTNRYEWLSLPSVGVAYHF
jgi:outer membrane immunogenic protein